MKLLQQGQEPAVTTPVITGLFLNTLLEAVLKQERIST